ASDRYVVSWICGLSANGILSVANKIPSILNIFQAIFNQAWQLSTVKSYDPEDKDKFFTNTYNMYNFALTEVCSLLIVLDIVLSRILYAKDFFEAWKYVPFYLIAILFASLSGFFTGIFKAVKDGKTESLTTTIGAICNIVINLILVFSIGVIGAAIATAISYIIIWALKIYKAKKYISLKTNLKRDIFAYVLLFVQTILLLTIKESFILYIALAGITIIITLMYIPVIKNLFISAKNIIKNKFKANK
ncbi:MAG: oligosaccharide flippase family protein, partial [Eubacterium sp.]|nr:oligosaccharide flippase family protein [Eubacterium sp.]